VQAEWGFGTGGVETGGREGRRDQERGNSQLVEPSEVKM